VWVVPAHQKSDEGEEESPSTNSDSPKIFTLIMPVIP